MKLEESILICIKERPGISAKKIISCIDSKTINLSPVEEYSSEGSIYKHLRTLKRNGSVHNRGDRWYRMNSFN
ncbi:hypothetical protein SAMN04487975_11135 [Planococcus glaciei]|nr:hypothetical protein SAMN04487975_11135 [Planococcus glaciei]